MPTVGLKKSLFDDVFGKSFICPRPLFLADAQLDELCFEYGLELDEVAVESVVRDDGTSSEETVYKIEVPANRYDLLCLEGLTRALQIFYEKQETPIYSRVDLPKDRRCSFTVDAATSHVRPFVASAILRDVAVSVDAYNTIIDLQEKLHQNLCRKRTLVAIGVHDLDTLKAPFVYTAKPPTDISFIPLNQSKSYTAAELMDLYANDSHLRHYLHIIKDLPLYPVIYDSNGVVLSMPPIINGNHSKVGTKTRNILIECTGTDLNKCNVVLDTLVTMFSQYCATPFCVESVDVVYADGRVMTCPNFAYREETLSVASVNKKVGANIGVDAMLRLLKRMSLHAERVKDSSDLLLVRIPPTRHDIIHVVDIIEDVAIAFGYNNITKQIPQAYTFAQEFQLNKLTDALRLELAMADFTEALTFALCSRSDISTKLRHDHGTDIAVHISNPKTLEFQVARTTLIPGILKTISHNRNMPLPLKLFEIQDVIVKDSTKDVGSRNERRLAAIYYGKTPALELIHGLLDRIMQLLELKPSSDGSGYHLRPCEDATYFPGRCVEVIGLQGKRIGMFGILHPDVLAAFDLKLPASAIEIVVEPFL